MDLLLLNLAVNCFFTENCFSVLNFISHLGIPMQTDSTEMSSNNKVLVQIDTESTPKTKLGGGGVFVCFLLFVSMCVCVETGVVRVI